MPDKQVLNHKEKFKNRKDLTKRKGRYYGNATSNPVSKKRDKKLSPIEIIDYSKDKSNESLSLTHSVKTDSDDSVCPMDVDVDGPSSDSILTNSTSISSTNTARTATPFDSILNVIDPSLVETKTEQCPAGSSNSVQTDNFPSLNSSTICISDDDSHASDMFEDFISKNIDDVSWKNIEDEIYLRSGHNKPYSKKCSACEFAADEEDKFCSQCGAKLSDKGRVFGL